MKKVSLIQPILDAVDETDDSITKHMNQLIKWAKYCEKAIGSRGGYPFKIVAVNVTGTAFTLPDDCYRPLALYLGDLSAILNLRYAEDGFKTIHVENLDDDEGLEYVWEDLSYPNHHLLKWEEIGNKLSLVDEFDNQDVTLVYQYIETDFKGYWIVNESHSEAIKRYIIYMVAKKYQFKNFKSDKLTRQADIAMVKEYERQYSYAIRNARALDTQENPIDTRG